MAVEPECEDGLNGIDLRSKHTPALLRPCKLQGQQLRQLKAARTWCMCWILDRENTSSVGITAAVAAENSKHNYSHWGLLVAALSTQRKLAATAVELEDAQQSPMKLSVFQPLYWPREQGRESFAQRKFQFCVQRCVVSRDTVIDGDYRWLNCAAAGPMGCTTAG